MFKDNKRFDNIFEIIIAALLGLTAVVTAYASWQASLYGGEQATNYARGTARVSEGSSLYIEALQSLNRDMQVQDEINSLRIDLTFADANGEEEETARIEWKLDEMMTNNLSEELAQAIEWSDAQTEETGTYVSPFEMEGFVEAYYEEANAVSAEGEQMLLVGQEANRKGDVLNMTTVIFAVVLFLLGIINSFKSRKIKLAMVCLSVVALVFATVMMLSIPMLTVSMESVI